MTTILKVKNRMVRNVSFAYPPLGDRLYFSVFLFLSLPITLFSLIVTNTFIAYKYFGKLWTSLQCSNKQLFSTSYVLEMMLCALILVTSGSSPADLENF